MNIQIYKLYAFFSLYTFEISQKKKIRESIVFLVIFLTELINHHVYDKF